MSNVNNLQEELIHCPKCNSTQIHSNHKGYGLKRGIAGGLILGAPGLLAGLIGRKKVEFECYYCGRKWSLADQLKWNKDNALPPEVHKKAKEMTDMVVVVVGLILIVFLVYIITNEPPPIE